MGSRTVDTWISSIFGESFLEHIGWNFEYASNSNKSRLPKTEDKLHNVSSSKCKTIQTTDTSTPVKRGGQIGARSVPLSSGNPVENKICSNTVTETIHLLFNDPNWTRTTSYKWTNRKKCRYIVGFRVCLNGSTYRLAYRVSELCRNIVI